MFVDSGTYFLLLSKVQRPKDHQLKVMVMMIYGDGVPIWLAYEVVIQRHTLTLRALQTRLRARSGGLITFRDLANSYRLNNPSKYAKKRKVV